MLYDDLDGWNGVGELEGGPRGRADMSSENKVLLLPFQFGSHLFLKTTSVILKSPLFTSPNVFYFLVS